MSRRSGPILGLEERVLGMSGVSLGDLPELRVTGEQPAGDRGRDQPDQQDDDSERPQEAGHHAVTAAAEAARGRCNTTTRAAARARSRTIWPTERVGRDA